MTSYTRSPRKVTVHCDVPGCGWIRTYFATARKSPEQAASSGLTRHLAAKHKNRKRVSIAFTYDKLQQSLRPLGR